MMNKEFNILFLSNMMEAKGVWVLLEACQILKDRGVSIICHFVGKWSDIDEATFMNRVMKLNLEHCIVAYGAKYGSDKDSFFENADVFVFPTFYHNEAFPLVLLEAMQYKLPCIATKVGGIPDIIDDGVTGYLVEVNDVTALANKIEHLIQAPELRLSMATCGYDKFMSNYTLQCFETKMSRILLDCCSENYE